MPSVAQIFAHTLKKIGVRFVFGVPSGNMIDYIDALREEEGIDFVLDPMWNNINPDLHEHIDGMISNWPKPGKS